MQCMTKADSLEMGSIGFPSLGTGNLGYPAILVAHTMFEAALDYGRQHPNTVISDVFFILHKKDKTLTQVRFFLPALRLLQWKNSQYFHNECVPVET